MNLSKLTNKALLREYRRIYLKCNPGDTLKTKLRTGFEPFHIDYGYDSEGHRIFPDSYTRNEIIEQIEHVQGELDWRVDWKEKTERSRQLSDDLTKLGIPNEQFATSLTLNNESAAKVVAILKTKIKS